MKLLENIDALRRYVTVDAQHLPEPVMVEAERQRAVLLTPLLGETLLEWLEAQEAGASDLADKLQRKVEAPLARISMGLSLDELQVSIDNTGIHIQSTDTHKTAFQWQVNDLSKTLLKKGYQDMVSLLDWLEEHRADSDELQAWAAGPGQAYRSQLIVSAKQFSFYENIQESWPVFEALKPVMRTQEFFILETQLGTDFLRELRTQVRTRAVTAENQTLLEEFVWPALASCTLARAVPELGLRLTGDGIELMVARIDNSNSKEADAGLDMLLSARAWEAQRAADIRLEKMRTYLNKNASATRFATYFTAGPYRAPSTVAPPLNTAESRVYRVF